MPRRSWPVSLFVIALLALDGISCGGAGDAPRSASGESSQGAGGSNDASDVLTTYRSKDSNDGDDDPSVNDDTEVLDFGHPANSLDAREVTSVVRRYYAAAATGDGHTVCSLLYSLFAENLAEKGGQVVPSTTVGKACAAVASRILQQAYPRFVAEGSPVRVVRVRVDGKSGLAILTVPSKAEPRNILVHREHGGWKVEELFDHGMP